MKIFIFYLLSISIISLSFVEAEAEEGPSLIEGKRMYIHYCASCHGNKGDGKGFNAKHLDPRPAVHTDRKFMRKRTDKELADAIIGGGKMIGKATLMPPWGEVLSNSRIKSLVMYMRELCSCTGT